MLGPEFNSFFQISSPALDTLLRKTVNKIKSDIIKACSTRRLNCRDGICCRMYPPEKIQVIILKRLNPNINPALSLEVAIIVPDIEIGY